MKECLKCAEAEELVTTWLNKQGHDRCWYYPEIFRKLANHFDLKAQLSPELPPREEFEEGCRRFQNEEYSK